MRHRAARSRLSQLLDDTLPFEVERRVWEHVAGCPACRQRLAEFEACALLVERLPSGVIPLAASVTGQHRLEGLARWSPEPQAAHGQGPQTAFLAIAAAVLACVMAFAGSHTGWLPRPDAVASAPIQVAYVLPATFRAR